MKNSRYNKKLKGLAKANRKSMPKSAVALWKYVLSRKQLMGYAFKRERPIDKYIVDFYCQDLKLVIEVDGITHFSQEQIARDALRDHALNTLGYHVIRINALDVLNNINQVVRDLESWVEERDPSPVVPTTPSGGG